MNVYRNITLAEAVARYDMGGCAALTDSELLQIALSLDEKESEGAAEALLSGESESPMDGESGKKMSALQEILRRFSGDSAGGASPYSALRISTGSCPIMPLEHSRRC